MGKIRKPKREKVPLCVYVVFFRKSNCVYVGQCRKENIHQVYGLHKKGVYKDTKDMFAAINDSIYPDVFALSFYDGIPGKSLTYIFAWYKYFQKNGFGLLISDENRKWLDNISDTSAEVYGTIKDISVETVFAEEKCLIKNYIPRSEVKGEGASDKHEPVKLTAKMSSEEADQIRNNAKKAGLSISSYMKNMALNGVVIQEDSLTVREFIDMGKTIAGEISKLRKAIDYVDGVYPAHLDEIKRIETTFHEFYRKLASLTLDSADQNKRAAAASVRKVISHKK